ncbi:MAG: PEP-utilizing enzyme [Bilophila wadsworthia]
MIRFMGSKTMKIVYDENGGTKEVPVPERECMLWALTPTQAEQVAKGVRAVSKAYDGMIMDTEFCIDSKGMLWFVQARPETRWNEELALHPHTIFMRRREVEPKAAAAAEILLTGNGASRGAGQGKVRFLRSALELNRVGKGEILAAERTDPDMVPGMRVASAILADVGGDTSHAAITSRELGIAAVIGIQNPTALQALDGLDVTVDGTRGRVYRGLLPLHEVGGEMDVEALPQTKTRVGLVLADIGQACSCPASATCRTLKWACCAPNSCSATWACTLPRWKPSTTANWNASSRRRSANWTPSCARPSANSLTLASCRWISASANTSATSPASRKNWKSSAKRTTSAIPTKSWPCIGVCAKLKSCWTNTPNVPRASTARWRRPRIWPNTSASSWATSPNCWPCPAIPPK